MQAEANDMQNIFMPDSIQEGFSSKAASVRQVFIQSLLKAGQGVFDMSWKKAETRHTIFKQDRFVSRIQIRTLSTLFEGELTRNEGYCERLIPVCSFAPNLAQIICMRLPREL